MKNKILPTVAIIIPAFNEGKYIEQCINSLLALDYPKELISITVVDNGSTDDTVQIAENYPVEILIKKGGKVGGVRNYGVSNSSSEILAFIDGDCIAGRNWLLAAVTKLNKGNGAVGGNYLLRKKPSWVETAWIVKNEPIEGPTESLIGGSIILSRTLFAQVGGFDEEINAGEDTKLTKDILKMSESVCFVKDCAVIHLGFPYTLRNFMKRQFWHSSSYIKSNNGVFKDKTFIFTVMFILSFLALIGFITSGNIFYLAGAVFLVILPYIFGWHRLNKVGLKKILFFFRLKVFILDFLYFSARAVGLIVSCLWDPYKK